MPTSLQDRAATVSKRVSPWVWAFRCLRWSTYLAALITLILLLHRSAPPPVQVTPQAEASAEKKVELVQESASEGEKATLRLDNSELNSYLASHLNLESSANAAAPTAPQLSAAQPASVPAAAAPASSDPDSDALSSAEVEQARSNVKDVKVQMEGDTVHAYVVFDVHGKDMTLQLVGRLGSSDGFLKFEPISGQLGALPIPQSTLEAAVARLMDSPENKEKLRLPSDVSEMHIENGQLVATYN
jgi:hypothetical protein